MSSGTTTCTITHTARLPHGSRARFTWAGGRELTALVDWIGSTILA
jgi:hypothetical protein